MNSAVDHEVRHFAYPKKRRIIKADAILTEKGWRPNICWFAQFWPYGPVDNDPIFCLSNRWTIQACRIDRHSGDASVEVLGHFEINPVEEDQQTDTPADEYCSAAWAYIKEDEPLLLGAGDHGYIRVFDVGSGNLKTTLEGHGKGFIHELSVHPKYPWIFASASMDQSIRIWDLRRWNSKHEPSTIVICGAGNGHQESILTVNWHDSGRYLVSGAFDNRVCVWTIPDLAPESSFWNEIAPATAPRRANQVHFVQYPHFTSSAVHENYVDCVRFYGDFLISKAADEDKIVFWSITGFDPSSDPPDAALAPKASAHLDTRNGFTRCEECTENGVAKIIPDPAYASQPLFQRILELENSDCKPFFIRFDLLKRSHKYPDLHPILACGNAGSSARFWDLEALDRGYDYHMLAPKSNGRRGKGTKKGVAQNKGGRGGRLNPLPLALSRSDSASASLPSLDGTGPASGATSRSASTDRSSIPTVANRSLSTDGTSLGSEASGALVSSFNFRAAAGTVDAPFEPPEDRIRFPLTDHKSPLEKAHYMVDLSDAKGSHARASFTSRAVAWSPDGRWCVIAGETTEYKGVGGVGKGKKAELKEVQIGMAVVLERNIPRVGE